LFALNDTIVAIATAPGEAGLAVLRVSGIRAVEIADAVFRGASPLAQAGSHTLHFGRAIARDTAPSPGAASPALEAGAQERWDSGARADSPDDAPAGAQVTTLVAAPPFERTLDEVVAAVFRTPRSFTREDVVELSCHGGRLSAERILDALLAAGGRLARPGEFTLRAFLNGRIDLARAEAVADLIHAETRAAHDLALAQLAGELSSRIDALSERSGDALAEVEARVDFVEDVGGIEVPPHVLAEIQSIERELAALLDGAPFARAVREGVAVPLVGRPNAGKSSLFNALLGEARALVTPVPGTTRDRVSEALELAGVRVTLSDTAGLRDGAELVESAGIGLTHEAIARASAIVWVLDGSRPLEPEDRRLEARFAGKRVVIALNKRDLGSAVGREAAESLARDAIVRVVEVSALTGDGLSGVRSALVELLGGGAGDLGLAVSNPRHAEALSRAGSALARAAECARVGAPGEIVALEIREAIGALGEVTGRNVSADLLERIFSRFCVGK
jgi:tRNA modification GTPase